MEPKAASVASLKIGPVARLRTVSAAVHSAIIQREASCCHRTCQWPIHSARPPPFAAPARSKRTVVLHGTRCGFSLDASDQELGDVNRREGAGQRRQFFLE